MNLSESVDSYGLCTDPFKPTIDETNKLLSVLSDFNLDFALRTDKKLMLDGLLSNFLNLTNSEYGFIGERLLRSSGTPYLKTYAITNITWDEATRDFYEKHAPKGLEFDKKDSLFGYVIHTGNALISNGPATDPRAGGIPDGHPALDTFMGIPLFIDNQYLGMLGIANRPSGYDAELLRYLSPLINSTAALIHAARMEAMASHDHLTGIANRRIFDESYIAEVSRYERHKRSLSLLLIDIDHFKNINDTFGHSCGDRILIKVTEILSNRVRAEDLIARYGGEEFAVLLPDTSIDHAKMIAEELRQAISNSSITTITKNEPVELTISIGVATLEGNEHSSLYDLLERADNALYNAKRLGRNQVCDIPLENTEV